MYILFEKNTGILQIGFRPWVHLGLLYGVYFNQKSVSFKDRSNDVCVLSFDFYVFKSSRYFSKDFRTCIKKQWLKSVISFFLQTSFWIKIVLQKQSIKKRTKAIFVFTSLCFVLIYCFQSTGIFGFFSKENRENATSNSESFAQEQQWTQEAFLKFFIETKTAAKVSEHKNDFYSGVPLKIKGISDFEVIPLSTQQDQGYEYQGYIALPYASIISIQDAKTSYVKPPEFLCEQMTELGNENHPEKALHTKMAIFQISHLDQLIIVNHIHKLNPNQEDEFSVFSENYFSKGKICEYFQKGSRT